ncbi:hypothetical protein [Leptothermofonsia sp. ETS-13]|uniref:hypothetical protein n=1 Tax=Leptothermofonsia sp. ETS-13 TaxID=3035696 RepID=UPI003BA06167
MFEHELDLAYAVMDGIDARTQAGVIALRGCVRTLELELEREWGLRPQPGVPPLHPVLTIMTTAISS